MSTFPGGIGVKKKKGKSGKREEGRPIRKEDGVRESNFWIDA
jgi:hypothetical protein